MEYNDKIIRLIKEEMTNIGVDINTINNEVLEREVNFVWNGNKNIIDFMDLECNVEDCFMIVFAISQCDFESIINKIDKKLNDNKSKYGVELVGIDEINIFYIFDSVRNKMDFSRRIAKEANKIRELITNKLNITNSKIRINNNFLICINTQEKDFTISITSRIRALEKKDKIQIDNKNEFLNVRGYVFTARLLDIVKIYNCLGSELFRYNVRCSIKDELEVDKNIELTLKNEQNRFWYLNNGITMVVDGSVLDLRKNGILKLHYNNKNIISIINGAQTVSTAAEYFYDNSSEKSNEAQVMFRVIQINTDYQVSDENQTEYNKNIVQEINKISIALNRQKPIKCEDVAYTVPFVNNINNLKEKNNDKKEYFRLVRRGEKNGYDLVEFFRIIKAYLYQLPGQALNSSAKKLLKVKENDYGERYFEDLGEENSKIDENSFEKLFSPVSFVKKLLEKFSESQKRIMSETKKTFDKQQIDKNIENILRYGKWYFVSYIIYILNDKNCNDFTNFEINADINDEEFDKIVEEFADIFYKCISTSHTGNLTISNFKKEELYKVFVEATNEDKEKFDKTLKEKFKVKNNFTQTNK